MAKALLSSFSSSSSSSSVAIFSSFLTPFPLSSRLPPSLPPPPTFFRRARLAFSMASSPSPPPPKKVLIPIAYGTEEIEAVVLVDILRRAGADVSVASIEQDLQIEASRRVKLVADAHICSCEGQTFDLVALPGGMPGSSRLRDCELLKRITIAQAEQGRLFGAICAAPAVALEEWGLLEGRKATCHPAFIYKLKSSLTVGSRVQRDGIITTSRGVGTALDFALSFVEQLYGKEKFEDISKPLVLRSKNGAEPPKEEYNSHDWSMTKPRVLVPIAHGTEEMEAVIIIDVLRRAGATVVVASVEESLQVVASRKVKIVADKLLQDVEGSIFDLIILPGGMPGAERLSNCEILNKTLKEQAEANRLFGAICAAPAVVLEANGLLKGKKATCHPAFANKLSDQSAVDTRVVIDGASITSRGPGTALEFALSIVEKFFGQEKAVSIAEAMVFQYP